MDQSEAVKDFLRKIKLKYREKRLNDEEQLFPLKKLVRLELVEGEQRQGYAAGQTRGRDNHAIKRTPLTAYSDILKAKDGDSVRKVLVEGDAGIGKTTLCTALSKDWANGELFQEFNMLLLLYLRQKKIASARSLLGLLKALHPSSEVCESIAKYIQGQEYKVLIIADGWDELSKEDSSKKLFLYEFLFGETYCVSVIVTSRPYASVSLRRLPCIDRLIEVCGFSKDNIKKFIDCKFVKEADKGSGLLEQLEGNPLVRSICSVPLNCASVCHLWDCLGGVLPTTMTGFYTKIILNIILCNMRKKEEYEDFRSLPHFEALPEPLKQPWSNVCELAFQTLSKDKIVFSYDSEDLSRKFRNLTTASAEVRYFGLLQSAEPILVDGHGVSFHFLHLIFQEYLAALYLVRQPTDKQPQLCQSYAGSERFDMVWRFFFGIKFVIYKQAVDLRVLSALLNKYRSRYDYKLLLCQIALEANQRNVNALIASKIEDDVSFHAHTAFDSAAVIHVLANLRNCRGIKIDLSNCGLGDKQIAALTSALAGEHRMVRVKRLNLSDGSNKLSDQNLADLFDRASPAFNQSLWYVNLSYNNNTIGRRTINSLTRVLAESLLVASEVDGYDEWKFEDYTSLILAETSLGVDGVRALADALCADRLAYLQELSLYRSLTDNANTNAELILALGSGHCSRLKVLDLSRNNLGTPGGKAIGTILPRLHSRLFLTLEETMLGDEGISALVQNLNDTVLSGLILDSNDIKVAGMSRLAESVCTGSIKLHGLFVHLENNPLRLGGVISVVKILTSDHFQPLITNLSGCQLTTAGGIATNPGFRNAVDVQRFICSQQLQTTYSFHEFVVGRNNFSGEGIHILAAFMYACPCMELLGCRSCGITSNDLKQLLILLSELKLKFPCLNVWGLSDNDIDDDGVSALIQHLSMFPKLRDVRLFGQTRVSCGMLKTLKENLDTRKNSSGSDSEGDSTSDSDMIESEDHGEDSSSHTEDSDTEEQYKAAKETGITTVTLKDMGNGPGLSSSEEPSSSKRVRTMEDEGVEQLQLNLLVSSSEEPSSSKRVEDEGVEQLQLNLVETTTIIGAGSESSQQEVVHPSTSSTSTQLDLVLASEHGEVSKHLGQIGDDKCEWEGPIAEQLGLTEEQYRTNKETGITTVTLKGMGNRTRLSSIEEPPSSKRVRTMEDEGVEQLQSAVQHSASAEATTMEAECESGDQQEVIHPSASSSPATGSSRDCHSEKASLHVADSDEEVKLVSDFKLQSFEENSEFPYVSATTRWELENVHGVGLNGTGVVIATLDTGIDTKHDAFKDKLTHIKSRDFLSDNNCAFSKPESHGTMAAFVAAGRGFIAKHIQKGGETKPLQKPIDIASGVAPSAKLVICRLETNIKCIIKALNWLIEEKKKEQNEWGVDVVSMSWGVVNEALNESAIQDRKKVREQIEELSRLKVIFVAAAGNYGDTKPVLFPARLSNVISVGAFDPYSKPANFTPSYGTDVYAPGTKIVFPLVHEDIHDGMAVTQGTSCATPAIAGLVALKIQFERNKHEYLKDTKDNLYVKSILAGGERIHFEDMKEMFKRMRMDSDRPHVLLPYEYYRDICRLNI